MTENRADLTSLRASLQAGMQIGEQGLHLCLVEATGKRGHHALARQNDLSDSIVRRRNSAGKRAPAKDPMQVRRNLLEGEVIVLVAMGAPHRVQVLPFLLLGGEGSRSFTPRHQGRQSGRSEKHRIPKWMIESDRHAFNLRCVCPAHILQPDAVSHFFKGGTTDIDGLAANFDGTHVGVKADRRVFM